MGVSLRKETPTTLPRFPSEQAVPLLYSLCTAAKERLHSCQKHGGAVRMPIIKRDLERHYKGKPAVFPVAGERFDIFMSLCLCQGHHTMHRDYPGKGETNIKPRRCASLPSYTKTKPGSYRTPFSERVVPPRLHRLMLEPDQPRNGPTPASETLPG